jgi:hypothetical protein
MADTNESSTPKSPRDYDAGTSDRVEKKPKTPESPQQQHDNEDHG